MIVSLYTTAATASGIAFTDSTYMDFANILVWKDSIVTDTSLSQSAGSSLFYRGMATGGVTVPQGQGYVVRIDYQGPKSDVFMLADGNRMECSSQGAASVSVVPDNSVRYYVGLTSTISPTTDVSGIGNLTYPSLPANCNRFYFQNLAISTIVTVDAPLALNATASLATGCPGQSVTLAAQASGGSGNYVYTWSGNGSFSNPNASITTVILPTGHQTLTYTITVLDTVENTSLTRMVDVTVRGITVVLGPDTTIPCNTTLTLDAIVGGATHSALLFWNTGDSIASITVSEEGLYHVSVSNIFGCTDNDSIFLVQPPINQTANYSISTLYIQPNDTLPVVQERICEGHPVFFNNLSADTSTNWGFEWSFGDQTFDTLVNGFKIYDSIGVFPVKLKTWNQDSCTLTARTAWLEVLLRNHPLCRATNVATCPEAPIGHPGFRPQHNAFECIVQNEVYENSVEFEFPSEIEGYSISTIFITDIKNLPCGITYSLDNADRVYAPGETGCVTFRGVTDDPIGAYRITMEATIKAPLFTIVGQVPHRGFSFYLRVKDAHSTECDVVPYLHMGKISGCSTNVLENTSKLNANIFPNPSSGVFYIEAQGTGYNEWEIHVFDLNGREIFSKSTSQHNLQHFPIDIGDVGQGTYILRLNNGKTQSHRRIIVL